MKNYKIILLKIMMHNYVKKYYKKNIRDWKLSNHIELGNHFGFC
jgi:hypothetical protein